MSYAIPVISTHIFLADKRRNKIHTWSLRSGNWGICFKGLDDRLDSEQQKISQRKRTRHQNQCSDKLLRIRLTLSQPPGFQIDQTRQSPRRVKETRKGRDQSYDVLLTKMTEPQIWGLEIDLLVTNISDR